MNMRALIPVGVCWSTALAIWAFGCQKDGPQTTGAPPPKAAPKAGATTEAPKPAEAPKPTAAPKPAAAPEVPAADTAEALLERAIAAHGGPDKLRALDHMRVEGKGTYMGAMPYTSVMRYAAPGSWDVVVDSMGMKMVFGTDRADCWQTFGAVTFDCDEPTRAGMLQGGDAVQATHLLSLRGQAIDKADPVKVGDVLAPAVRAGEITLAFDPQTSLLVYAKYPGYEGRAGMFEEVYSDHKEVAGVKVPGHMRTSFEGDPLMDEDWVDVKIGEAAPPDAIARPAQVAAGTLVHRAEAPHAEAWTYVDTQANVAQALTDLRDFARREKLSPSLMGGVTVAPLAGSDSADGKPRVFVSVALESMGDVPEKQEGSMHIGMTPAISIAGLYVLGDAEKAWAQLDVLKAYMAQNGLTPLEGSRYSRVAYHEGTLTSPDSQVSMLMSAVQQPPTGAAAPADAPAAPEASPEAPADAPAAPEAPAPNAP